MVSTLSRQEKFNQVRRNFCFYLDIQEHELCRSISRRLQDMGLQQEQVLSARVTHVVRCARAREAPRWRREGRRADAMLERVRRAEATSAYVLLTVDKAIALLDKLYDTFFTAPKANIRLFTKHYIKIEFLDKKCRPLYKEFDEWPSFAVDLNTKRREKKEPALNQGVTVDNNYNNTNGQDHEMTRKNRPRIKEKEDASPVGVGYLAELASRSPLDSLLVNGERRSLRNMCNGGASPPPPAPAPAPAPPPALNGGSPHDDEPRGRRARRPPDDDKQYYKVVGVSTKLRSSGGFQKRKDEEPACDAKPLVVKFRKVRRSELSVLSDEAEQFMFPKRASSTSSTSSSDDDERERKSPPPVALERRRQARPTALKEESSEEDSWLDGDPGRKRRVATVVRRTRRTPCKPPTPEPEPPPEVAAPVEPETPAEAAPASPLREEPAQRCMKWEDGRLKYTPAVERLEFAFESVPRSEPWFGTFERQDRDRVSVRNIPRCFALYSTSPKLPYELGQLPPLKPDCCPLSALPAPAPRPRVERSYGTRGLASRAAPRPAPRPAPRRGPVAVVDDRPRKSPREHASTLAMLGSAGLLRRRHDDAKSTASEDAGDSKPEPPSEAREAEERLRAFLAGVFDDAADYDVDDADGGALPAAAAPPDVLALVSECDACDIIRDEIQDVADARRRRGRFERKNRTGWPNKRKPKKGSRSGSSEDRKTESSLDRSSVESSAANETCDEDDRSDAERPEGADAKKEVKSEDESRDETMDVDEDDKCSDDKPLRLDVKVLLENDKKEKPEDKAKGSRSSVSESDDRDERVRIKKKRALTNLAGWLQPVVRVARVDPAAARRLRSSGAGAGQAPGKTRSHRLR